MSDARREKRNFALVDGNGEEIGTYSGSQPRDAALKAARRGNKEIVLREKGTNKLHYFRGKRVLVKAPKDAPKWIADAAVKREGKIYKAEVGKVGTATLNSPRLADNDKSLFQVPGKAGTMADKAWKSGYVNNVTKMALEKKVFTYKRAPYTHLREASRKCCSAGDGQSYGDPDIVEIETGRDKNGKKVTGESTKTGNS